MEELLLIERKMISAKYDGKKIKYWWYKRKYQKLKSKIEKGGNKNGNNLQTRIQKRRGK